jgi:hypothetical protein
MGLLTEKQFQNYLNSEVEKIGLSEGWLKKQPNIPVSQPKSINESLEFESSKETINESESVTIEEVKILAEEFKRMRELVDFRSPLLLKENQ